MNSRFTRMVLIALILVITQTVSAQVGIGTASPNNSAALDISPSTAKGLLVPRMTATQRTGITSPATGLLVYQTDGVAGFYVNTGTPGSPNWVQMVAANPGTSGQVLTSNGSSWSSQAASGGGGSLITFQTTGSSAYSISAASITTNEYVLTYTGSVNADITLPAASSVTAGKKVYISSTAAENILNVATSGSDTFFGYDARLSNNTSLVSAFGMRFSSMIVISNGVDKWFCVNYYGY